MGSLASRPKVPAVQTVYMPVYTPSPSTTPVPATVGGAAPLPTGQEQSQPPPADDPVTAQRRESLLERRRGALSTVLTGFRGLLNQTLTPQRKSLLGE